MEAIASRRREFGTVALNAEKKQWGKLVMLFRGSGNWEVDFKQVSNDLPRGWCLAVSDGSVTDIWTIYREGILHNRIVIQPTHLNVRALERIIHIETDRPVNLLLKQEQIC
jgi:hypothetical protein